MNGVSRPLALSAVSATTAAGCSRLFGDAGWVVPVFAAVVGAHVVGALTRRGSLGAAVAAQGAGLILLLAEGVGGHTAYGLPTPATVTALGRAIHRAPEALQAAITPAPTTPELILLVVTGLWVAAAVADGLARRRGAGLLAVLPLAVFPVVVAALGTDRWRTTLTFAFAAASALYAALESAADLPLTTARLVGPVPPPVRRALLRSGRSRDRRWGGAIGDRGKRGFGVGRAAGLAGPALVAGVAAVVLGPVVPGVGRAVVDVHALGVTLDVSRVELNPMVDIRPQLLAARRTELFTVRATAPAYWRLTALDRFDGRRWSPSRPALHRRDGPAVGKSRLDPAADGDRALHQDFQLTALDSPWLPAADKAIRIKAAGARLDPETDSLVTKKGSQSVRAYRVESRLPPGPAGPQPSALPAAADRRPGLARYLALPNRLPARVRALAERFTSGATTSHDRAAALQDRLRTGFSYDENAPPGGSIDALEHFLFTTRRGFCEQFAGAFAALARAVGLPTRVAVGFTPGVYDEADGVWRVTTREAHAWPEVFLDGVGWTAFEPTPGRSLPDPDARVLAHPALQRVAAVGGSSAGGGGSALARVDPGGGAGLDAGPGNRSGGIAGAVTHTGAIWWLAAAGLGLLVVPPVTKSRRRSLRRGAGADRAVLAAWAEAVDRLGEAGLARRGAETPLEFAVRSGGARPGVAPPMRRLAALVNRAAYGPPVESGGAEAWAATDQVVRALDAHDPRWVRWRRRLDPRPLRRSDRMGRR
jgi:transglutaminase-like putative cysteine protease